MSKSHLNLTDIRKIDALNILVVPFFSQKAIFVENLYKASFIHCLPTLISVYG